MVPCYSASPIPFSCWTTAWSQPQLKQHPLALLRFLVAVNTGQERVKTRELALTWYFALKALYKDKFKQHGKSYPHLAARETGAMEVR